MEEELLSTDWIWISTVRFLKLNDNGAQEVVLLFIILWGVNCCHSRPGGSTGGSDSPLRCVCRFCLRGSLNSGTHLFIKDISKSTHQNRKGYIYIYTYTYIYIYIHVLVHLYKYLWAYRIKRIMALYQSEHFSATQKGWWQHLSWVTGHWSVIQHVSVLSHFACFFLFCFELLFHFIILKPWNIFLDSGTVIVAEAVCYIQPAPEIAIINKNWHVN